MNTRDRLKAYSGQTKTARFTPRQRRRANKKAQREFKHYRRRWVTTEYPRWSGPVENEF